MLELYSEQLFLPSLFSVLEERDEISELVELVCLVFLFFSYKKKPLIKVSNILFAIGWVVLIVFVGKLWNELDRPPMRTLGETRL